MAAQRGLASRPAHAVSESSYESGPTGPFAQHQPCQRRVDRADEDQDDGDLGWFGDTGYRGVGNEHGHSQGAYVSCQDATSEVLHRECAKQNGKCQRGIPDWNRQISQSDQRVGGPRAVSSVEVARSRHGRDEAGESRPHRGHYEIGRILCADVAAGDPPYGDALARSDDHLGEPLEHDGRHVGQPELVVQ